MPQKVYQRAIRETTSLAAKGAGVDLEKAGPLLQRRAMGRIEQTLMDGEGTLPNQPKTAARDDILPHNSNECIFSDGEILGPSEPETPILKGEPPAQAPSPR